MSAIPSKPLSKKTRADHAKDVSRVVARIPLVSEILRTLSRVPMPHPGDGDIRHGCERAMTSILSELAKIDIAPPGALSKPEEQVRRVLENERNESPIHADLLDRVRQFVDRIFGHAEA